MSPFNLEFQITQFGDKWRYNTQIGVKITPFLTPYGMDSLEFLLELY